MKNKNTQKLHIMPNPLITSTCFTCVCTPHHV